MIFGKITRRHIANTKDTTSAINRFINLSPAIYVAEKNITLEAINITVTMRVSPVVSNRKERDKGWGLSVNRSHVKIISLLEKSKNKSNGRAIITITIKQIPIIKGCHIIYKTGSIFTHGMSRNHYALHSCSWLGDGKIW